MPTKGTSPSQTGLSESQLNKKALCDYVVNVADGCTHGCAFCYVPSMPMIWGDPGDKFADAGVDDPQSDWGDYALYRDDVVENVATDCQRLLPDDWRTTRRGGGVVGISFGTDCYMDPRAGELTRGVVSALVGHDRPVRILTRNPKLLADLHGDFYASLPSRLVTVGSSIPSLDQGAVSAIEGRAPPVEHRLDGLADLADRGIPVYVSMSPTYPTMDRDDLAALLGTLKERLDPTVVFHEPINPRSGNLEGCVEAAREAGRPDLSTALNGIRQAVPWREYALRQLAAVQAAAEDVGQRVHLWPDELLANVPHDDARAWVRAWRDRASPEAIGDGDRDDGPYPDVPTLAGTEQVTLEEVSEP